MFEHKEYIYEVYKARSFTKAAENLYISQPSLSLTIKKAENRIGTQLFDRGANPIQLTASGEEYIRCVEQIMDIERGYENFLNNLNELKVGNLSIGTTSFFASYKLPDLITAFKTKYPLVSIHLAESDTANLEKRLFSGGLDLIVDNYNFDETIYQKQFFYNERMLIAAPKKLISTAMYPYALTTQDIVTGLHLQESTQSAPPSLFKQSPFILLRQNNDTRVRADKLFGRGKYKPHIILELDQLATAFNVAYSGLGLTLTSDTLVREVNPDNRIVFFKLDNSISQRDNFFYYRHNKYLSKAMEVFMLFAHMA